MFSNLIGFVDIGGDPPKFPLKRGTLRVFSPLLKAGALVRSWGGSKGLKTRPSPATLAREGGTRRIFLYQRGIELPSPCKRGVGGEVTIGRKRTLSLSKRR